MMPLSAIQLKFLLQWQSKDTGKHEHSKPNINQLLQNRTETCICDTQSIFNFTCATHYIIYCIVELLYNIFKLQKLCNTFALTIVGVTAPFP